MNLQNKGVAKFVEEIHQGHVKTFQIDHLLHERNLVWHSKTRVKCDHWTCMFVTHIHKLIATYCIFKLVWVGQYSVPIKSTIFWLERWHTLLTQYEALTFMWIWNWCYCKYTMVSGQSLLISFSIPNQLTAWLCGQTAAGMGLTFRVITNF